MSNEFSLYSPEYEQFLVLLLLLFIIIVIILLLLLFGSFFSGIELLRVYV